jgi:Na+-driven multidrug efflux pump
MHCIDVHVSGASGKRKNRDEAQRTIAIGVVLTVLFGLFSLPQLIFGLYLLNCWFRIHTAAV